MVEDQRGGDILNQTNSSYKSNTRLTPRGAAPSASRSGLHSKSSERDKKSQYSHANVSVIIQNNQKNLGSIELPIDILIQYLRAMEKHVLQ